MTSPYAKTLARAVLTYIAVSVAIASVNMVTQIGALGVALGPSGPLAYVLMTLQHDGYLVAQLSWWWLFALGLLGRRTGLFPMALNVLLMLGSASYTVDALIRFSFPAAAALSGQIFFLPELISEVALLVHLLVRGVRQPLMPSRDGAA